jgi:hypothetical protein
LAVRRLQLCRQRHTIGLGRLGTRFRRGPLLLGLGELLFHRRSGSRDSFLARSALACIGVLLQCLDRRCVPTLDLIELSLKRDTFLLGGVFISLKILDPAQQRDIGCLFLAL